MKIIVTGGAGFVGTNLIKRLHSGGHSVISFDNYSTGLKSNHIEGVTYIDTDIRCIPKKSKHFWADIDMVYHLAAIARIPPSFKRPEDYIQTNFNGTYEVVKFCVEHNIPLVYAGSSSKHNGRFKNPYTFSKDLGEDIITLYSEHFGLQSSITRFYNVYGPHQLTEGGYTTLIGRWINNIENDKDCVIYGDGTKRRDFTHIDDIIDALIRIPQKGAWGYSFELGRGKNYSVNEVADMFNIKPIYQNDKPGEAQITLNDDIVAKEILDWEARINLEDYIKGLQL
jgi:UDP-glucose 4-epimerase|tara:strand:- start:7055 stop:7903 length:849 start_codon:yes stop_codon:yes gene_type:complete